MTWNACGQCNRGKSSRFSVVVCGGLVDVTRRRNDPVLRPREGPPALIVPRDEDPLAFVDLEIVDTFMFLPRQDLQGVNEERAEYSIEVLKLNRDVLLEARREAYGTYRARLVEYRVHRDGGASERGGTPNSERRDSDKACTRRCGARCSASSSSSTSCELCSLMSRKLWLGNRLPIRDASLDHRRNCRGAVREDHFDPSCFRLLAPGE